MRIFYLIFSIFYYVHCNTHSNADQFKEIYKHHRQVYRGLEQRNHQTKEALLYLRSDQEKLAKIANLWSDYYKCSYSLMAKVTTSRRLPSTVVMAYVGSVARLPCGLCIAPGESKHLMWSFTKNLMNFEFVTLVHNRRYTKELDGNLSIYKTEFSDAGVYKCTVGKSISRLVIVEVVDDENYTMVKPSSHGSQPTPPELVNGLEIFTLWSKWSDCSHCGRVGFRRRYGLCYVRKLSDQMKNITTHGTHLDNGLIFDKITRKTFENFHDQLPCKSQYLPQHISEMNVVKQRLNEIMIGLCKVECQNSNDEVMEQAILPSRTITFATIGQTLSIQCSGTILQDTPILWHVGTKQLTPNFMNKIKDQRVYPNGKDQLTFKEIKYSDDNLYSCWQRDKLVGTIKVVTWSGEAIYWNRHTTLLIMVLAAGMVLRYSQSTLRNTQRRLARL